MKLQDLKNKALAEIRSFEAKANQAQEPLNPNIKLEEYTEESTRHPKLSGLLDKVDCLGTQAKLHVRNAEGRVEILLVRDARKIVISSGRAGETTLSCGPQRPPRRLIVEYVPRADRKLGTIGEAAVVEFK